MTGDEFKEDLRVIRMTQTAFAYYVNANRRTVATWAKEGPPHYVVVLLAWMKRTTVRRPPEDQEQTQEMVTEAMKAVIGHVIGQARLAAWHPDLIADAIIEIAKEFKTANNVVAALVDPFPIVAKRA